MWVVFVILGFVPPLFVLWWAVILAVVFIFKLLSRGRTEKLLLTNYRLIHLFPSGKFFMMNSIPYSQITDVRRGKVDSGITGFVLGLLDRLFRVGIVMVFTPESRFASLSVDNIKNPTAVIKFLNDKAGITK